MANVDVPLSPDGATNPAQKQAEKWLSLIDAACQREDKWRKDAQKYQDLYEAKKVSANSFNILYANTETMRPAVLSAIPRPRVRARWDNSPAIANTAATATERMLSFLSDTGSAAQSPFGATLKECVRQALVPGRGNAIFQYEPDIQQYATSASSAGQDSTEDDDKEAVQDPVPSNSTDFDSAGNSGGASAPTGDGAQVPQVAEKVVSETICGYPIAFDRIVFGYATCWTDIPWLAIGQNMTRGDLVKAFGKTKGNEINLDKKSDQNNPNNDGTDTDENKGVPNTALVWVVWHREEKEVLWVSEGYKEGPLKVSKDPLGLSGFYPVPEQLVFFLKSQSLTPVPLYEFYKEQATELNRVSQRINKIISVLKARGLYDKTLVNLDEMRSLEDGQFQPVANAPALGQNGSLDKAIWMWPTEKLSVVLQQLYVQREQTKQVIYEISGLSDIIRGSTVASETATAQKIKNQWGTLRLQDSQTLVGVFARNCFRIMAEIAINKFDPTTWERMTGMQLPSAAEKAQAQQQAQQLQGVAQQAMQQAQQAGIQDPSQLPPQLQQQVQQLQSSMAQVQQLIAKPSWEEVLQELKENVKDGYLVDIQTNSTLDATMTEDKQDLTALVTAITQMLQAFGPFVQAGAVPMPLVKMLLLSMLRIYRFGDEILDMVRNLPDQAPQQGQGKEDPAAQKAQAEIQVMNKKADIEQQSAQLDLQMKQKELEFQQSKLSLQMQEAQAEHEARMQEIADKRAASAANQQAKLAQIAARAAAAQMQPPATPAQPAGMTQSASL